MYGPGRHRRQPYLNPFWYMANYERTSGREGLVGARVEPASDDPSLNAVVDTNPVLPGPAV